MGSSKKNQSPQDSTGGGETGEAMGGETGVAMGAQGPPPTQTLNVFKKVHSIGKMKGIVTGAA
jgi:hypothetical protein